jgi:hypothetical protein
MKTEIASFLNQIAADKTNPTYCTRCEKVLNPDKIKWLELSQTDGKYYEEVPPGHESQGFFTFGLACSVRELKDTFKKR